MEAPKTKQGVAERKLLTKYQTDTHSIEIMSSGP